VHRGAYEFAGTAPIDFLPQDRVPEIPAQK